MREKKFHEAFGISIYRPAIDGLSAQEFEDLRPDLEKMAVAVSEKIPEKVDITGEQISGDARDRFVRVLDAEGKEKIEPLTLIKIDNNCDRRRQEKASNVVKKAGKKLFFERPHRRPSQRHQRHDDADYAGPGRL